MNCNRETPKKSTMTEKEEVVNKVRRMHQELKKSAVKGKNPPMI